MNKTDSMTPTDTADQSGDGLPPKICSGWKGERYGKLKKAVEGRFCRLGVGEVVRIKGRGWAEYTLERATWINSATISNVLCGVPFTALDYEPADCPNDQAHLSAPGGRVERNQKEQ